MFGKSSHMFENLQIFLKKSSNIFWKLFKYFRKYLNFKKYSNIFGKSLNIFENLQIFLKSLQIHLKNI